MCCDGVADWAEKLTEMGRGKHHIGDFLPPEELEKFMETFTVRFCAFSCQAYACEKKKSKVGKKSHRNRFAVVDSEGTNPEF